MRDLLLAALGVRVLADAARAGLLDALGAAPGDSLAELRARVQHPALEPWLGALVTLGLVDHDGARGRFSLARGARDWARELLQVIEHGARTVSARADPALREHSEASAWREEGIASAADPLAAAHALFAETPRGGTAISLDPALPGALADAVAHPAALLHFADAAARAHAGGQPASFGAEQVRAALLRAGFASVRVVPLRAQPHRAAFVAQRGQD